MYIHICIYSMYIHVCVYILLNIYIYIYRDILYVIGQAPMLGNILCIYTYV